MNGLRVLSVAAATGRIGYVFLIHGGLADWGLSCQASKSPEAAAKQMKRWVGDLKPEVVVTEQLTKQTRKGESTKAIIEAITRVAQNAEPLDVMVTPKKTETNKYVQAARLAESYPEIAAWVPKQPRIWESEPREMVYFEALGLTTQFTNTLKRSPRC